MLSATSPEVVEFVAAYEENRNLGVSQEWRANGWRVVIVAAERRKYLAIDESDAYGEEDAQLDVHRSGRFLVDRETGTVYTIRGYGQRGHRVGALDTLAASFRAGTATYRPEARAHVERGHARVASW